MPTRRLSPHLAADTESLQWVEAEPAGVSGLSEAVHELCVERPLQRRQAHQDHMLLLGGQLVPQDIMASSGQATVNIWQVLVVRFAGSGCGLIKEDASPLDEALQQAVQDVAPVPHQLDVLRRAVHTLSVQNGTLEHVTELLTRAWKMCRV